jgi:hypothetical protein
VALTEPRPYHRLFALSWSDFFKGTAFGVEPEMDLSLKQQFLDLVLIRRSPEPIPRRLPDGFEDLADHNLVTFKSFHEALDAWTLWELVGHFVNYRKQVSPSMQNLLPESDFRLFAVCARYPHNLAQQVPLTSLRESVYEVRLLTLPIRVIVISQLPLEKHNVILHVFSANKELLRYGEEHYRPRSKETSTLLYELFKAYSEDPNMPDQLQEFVRQSIERLLESLPAEELRKRLSPEERLAGLSAEEVVRALPPRFGRRWPESSRPTALPRSRSDRQDRQALRAVAGALIESLLPNPSPGPSPARRGVKSAVFFPSAPPLRFGEGVGGEG